MNRSTWKVIAGIAVLTLALATFGPLAVQAQDANPPAGGNGQQPAVPGGATPSAGSGGAAAAGGAVPCPRVCRTPGCQCAANTNDNRQVEITVARPETQPLQLAPGATFEIEIRVNAAGSGLMWSSSQSREQDRHDDPRNIGPEGDPKRPGEQLEDGRTRYVFQRRAPREPGTYWIHLLGSRLQQCCNPVAFASVAVQIEVVAPPAGGKKTGTVPGNGGKGVNHWFRRGTAMKDAGPTLDGLRNMRQAFESQSRPVTVPVLLDPDPPSPVPQLVIPRPARMERRAGDTPETMPSPVMMAPAAAAPSMPIERPGMTILGPGPDAPPVSTPAPVVIPGARGPLGVIPVVMPGTPATPPPATGGLLLR